MTVEELLDVLTPEQVCCHESMMAGQLALEDAGISAKCVCQCERGVFVCFTWVLTRGAGCFVRLWEPGTKVSRLKALRRQSMSSRGGAKRLVFVCEKVGNAYG